MAADKFSKIVVAVDGSDQSMEAAGYAIEMAKKHDSKLVVLSVVVSQIGHAYSSGMIGLATPSAINEFLEKSKQEAQQWFYKITEQAKAYGDIKIDLEVIVTPSSVVAAIVDYAEKNNVSLIVAGTRGRSGFKKLLLGSVASGLVTYASCPVMVIK